MSKKYSSSVPVTDQNDVSTSPGILLPGEKESNADLFVVGKPADAGTIGRTASALIVDGPCVLKGFTIVSHTAGATVRFSDAITATTPYVSSAMTTVAGHLAGTYIRLGNDGIDMVTGCYVTIK